MSEDQADQSAPEIPSLDSLMLDLDFDIGELRVPISAIETWQAGTIVELEIPEMAEGLLVTIRANGQAIAEGDLVQIDDRLAVRLARLLVKG